MDPSRKVITDNDKSALIQVLALFFLCVNILTCFVRVGAKLYIFKALKLDDILTIVGTLTSVAQSVALYEASEYGLGKHFDLLSVSQQNSFFKSQYVADIFLVLTLAICKVAYANGMRLLAKKNLLPLVFGCEIISIVWGVTSVIVVFFQCHMPSPWQTLPSSQCINRTTFYTYFSVFNMLSDLAAIVVMCWSVSQLQASWSNKSLVMCVFGSRILMIPAVIMQIIYSNRAFNNDDITFALWEASIAVIIVPFLAIASVCMPNFKFLLDTLESGQIRIDDLRRQGRSTSGSNGYYHYSGSHSHDSEGAKRSAGRSKNNSKNNSRNHVQNSKVSMSSALSKGHGKRGTDLDLTLQSQSEEHELTTFSRAAGGRASPSPAATSTAAAVAAAAEGGGGGGAGTATGRGTAATAASPGGHRHGGSSDGNTAWDQTSQTSQTILIHQSWRVDTQSAGEAEAGSAGGLGGPGGGGSVRPAGANGASHTHGDSHGVHGIGVAVGMGGVAI